MPAYNAAKTLRQTYCELPLDIIDDVLLVDDGSSDATLAMARDLGLTVFSHKNNRGYGKNQKTCYREALKKNGDVIIMVHPDYQYSPKVIVALGAMVAYGEYDSALASRILGIGALKGGMPLYKFHYSCPAPSAFGMSMSQFDPVMIFFLLLSLYLIERGDSLWLARPR